MCQGTGRFETASSQEDLDRGQRIVEETANLYGTTVERMRARSRQTLLVDARRTAARLMRDTTDLPLSSIGHLLGGRDHSTIINLLRDAPTAFATRATR